MTKLDESRRILARIKAAHEDGQGRPAGKQSESFARLVTETSLEELAGERSFARGLAHFKNGAVVNFVQTRNAIKARVLGSDEYRVALRPEGRRLEWSCTCPLGEEGAFCKHAVATGLAWLERRGANDASFSGDELGGAEIYLRAQPKEALVALLLEQASEDPDLRARLEAAALRRDPPADLKALKEAVRRALAVSGRFVDRRGMRAFLTRAESAVSLVRDLLAKRRAPDAVALADYAMRRGIVAYQKCDDSGGAFGDLLRQIAGLHLEACRVARPDGDALGAQLFELHRLDEWGFLDFENYAPLLGETGFARYRAAAERAWASVPPLGPGERRESETERFIITHIMEKLARYDGDTHALVAVKSRDLTHAYAFVEIAQLLAGDGRHDEALAWAERGWKAFADERDSRLVSFLVEAYRRQRRHDAAAGAAWYYFSRHPSLSSYQLLRKSVQGNGTWRAWRDKALAHVRAELQKNDSSRRDWHWGAGGRSLLVEIYLNEGDRAAALAEAKAGGCTEHVWMKLAKALEAQHPKDARDIYRARVDPIVGRGNNGAYDEAAELVRTIKKLMERTGKAKEFTAWLGELRTKHKAKRNFMQRLDRLVPAAS